ncbi:MAG: translation elongation factor Ts [Puniceicoccales bacterium]|jgi:elongation factor Ts|nr:translation elongation factor Ts [Puniceicoccales bacterium]
MVEINAKLVGELRGRTGAGFVDCKKALIEANGNIEEAIDVLRKTGAASAAKKASRQADEGIIDSYIHNGSKIGVLLELNCETDFVAKNSDFKRLAHDICMHIAASNPMFISKEDVPASLLEKEKEIAAAQAADKPANAMEKIINGKIDKWLNQICLMNQQFIKDPDKTISDLLTEHIAIIGENIRIGRFVRFQIGE